MADNETTWIRYWLEDSKGEWGKCGPTKCQKCGRNVEHVFLYCPWCGRKATGQKIVTVVVEDENA